MSSYFRLDEGKDGERKTKRYCFLYLDSKSYFQYHDVLIPASPRTTQVDHIIVSKFGIFVIETKTMNGWIYGDADGPRWTQVFHDKKYTFQNPLRQNYFHTQILAKYFEIDHSKMISVIVFWGDCQFQTNFPENVRREAFAHYIKRKKEIILNEEEINKACRILHDLKQSTQTAIKQEHSNRLNNSKICPLCESELKTRTVRTGSRTGTKFTGCSKFPVCRFTRDIKKGEDDC